ncbi:hypothetical protein HT031_002440 [Scenedesmus sp. PABB004]|nr:hypothetical protein HT031_002440 [Scenedesmus sp. PABB004]
MEPGSAPAASSPQGGAGSSSVDSGAACAACKTAPIAYACVPCGHSTLCRRCAMRQATGGKCKACGELFGELRRVDGAS